jgi:hypothetical protein
MKLHMDQFPVSVVELEQKKILVCTDQAETTKGRNVVVSNDLHNRMIKPHNPEVGMWKENVQRKPARKVKTTSAMLIEKYQWQLEEDGRYQFLEESSGTCSLKLEIDRICLDHAVHQSPRGEYCSMLRIRYPR